MRRWRVPGEELAAELVISRGEAGHLIDDAIDLTGWLPRTLTGMAAGLIDAGKAGWIAFYTRRLNPADTAHADQVLAAAAPELRSDQLARKADTLEKKLNPEGARARKERVKRDGQRVEARREASGNAFRPWSTSSSLPGRCSAPPPRPPRPAPEGCSTATRPAPSPPRRPPIRRLAGARP